MLGRPLESEARERLWAALYDALWRSHVYAMTAELQVSVWRRAAAVTSPSVIWEQLVQEYGGAAA